MDSHAAVYWPRDLVPATVPNARVLTYGYDTRIKPPLGPPATMNSVYDIAWDFLVALEAERRPEPSRPVLFIVHSLGGIVIKELLRRSSGCLGGRAHLRAIFESTIGIMFFGTPHGGADPRGLCQRIAEKAVRAAGFKVNDEIVKTLLPSSERLRELSDEFPQLALQEEWIIHSFQEQLGISFLNSDKVRVTKCRIRPVAHHSLVGGRGHIIVSKVAGHRNCRAHRTGSQSNVSLYGARRCRV